MKTTRRYPDTAQMLTVATQLRVVLGKLMRRLREEGSIGDLTSSQLEVVRHLEQEGSATVSVLARAAGMRPQSMGATVSALETAGLIAGTPDPEDGRQTLLALTPAAKAFVKASRAAREDWLFRTMKEKYSPDEQATIACAVELLERLVEPPSKFPR